MLPSDSFKAHTISQLGTIIYFVIFIIIIFIKIIHYATDISKRKTITFQLLNMDPTGRSEIQLQLL